MAGSNIERIVAQQLVHRLVSERLIERVYHQALISNVERGAYVECMIELALSEIRPSWRLTDTWHAWDLEQHETGARIEVKQSAARQTWSSATEASSRPSFDIAPRSGYYVDGGDQWVESPEPRRFADLYVFAWHDEADPRVADHRLHSQWQFFVVPEQDLPQQKRISLNPLRERVDSCSYDQLAERTQAALSTIARWKAEPLQ